MLQRRKYRTLMKRAGLDAFEVRYKETDLFIQAGRQWPDQVSAWVIEARNAIEEYARMHPGFIESHIPLPLDGLAPEPVRQMLAAGKIAGVGPMAAVAGAIAEFITRRLMQSCIGEVIVENGGDISLFVTQPITMGIFAGDSPFTGKIGIRLMPRKGPFAVCTSSGTVGHSTSFGTADAVTVIAEDGAIADAIATSIGNLIKSRADVASGIKKMQEYPQVLGGIIIKGDAIGAFGQLELVPL